MQDLYAAIAAEPYEPRGILHSEMALIIHTVRRLNVECVIETGRARGQSTYMLAKYLPDVEIDSLEFRAGHPDEAFARERLKGFANVALRIGDARLVLPLLVDAKAGKRIAILCDGPKGAAAVALLQECFKRPHVAAGFIHDMRRLDHGQPSPHRAAAATAFPGAKFSDHPRLAGIRWMDAKVVEANGPVGPEHEKEFGSYGPTVGVFLNSQIPINRGASPHA